ncbi:rhodanese-like domain-containing protein [uncultured Desulfuromusa sp.]|uniref:sulfurtransferase n=1 Tax=uncultured Desulfuromusa sp. TaxID=219183 RepID=UPI002AA875AC|nr:rhodanese-like domain-containing protein [uncultured Desulfuromusa sp.]
MQSLMLVSPQWLQDNLSNPEIQVIENTWNEGSYQKAHIAGAVCSPGNPYLKRYDDNGVKTQHVMRAEDFLTFCYDLGLKRHKHYVIYDDHYGLFAARFWCVCRYFGVRNISILNGSWRGWLEQNRPVSSLLKSLEPGTDIVLNPHENHFIGWKELKEMYRSPKIQIWDTRRTGEYDGTEETENQRRGHIPGAVHLSWSDLLTDVISEGAPRFLKSNDELERILSDLGLRRDKMIVTYCQSGIRAAFCIFILEMLGYPYHRLYDASMGEWTSIAETPLTL